MANDLNIPTIADGQADGQWQTSNDGDAALGNALADIYTVDFTAGNVTLTAAQFRSAMTFVPSNLSATRVLTIPSVKRALFFVHNTDAADTITVTKGSTTIAVGPSEIGVFNTDGTTNSLGGAVLTSGGGSVSPIGKHTLWIPAGAMTARTTDCAAAGTVETTTNKIMLKTFDFDASADENVQFSILKAPLRSSRSGAMPQRLRISALPGSARGLPCLTTTRPMRASVQLSRASTLAAPPMTFISARKARRSL
ncbi:hypothetical protein [Mesorhizobium temperatum]|uniref:hypothetical protein n=1 Tax=Mesorhizobium temperatum TaxID=241416 RepID=UPI001180F2F7|nr:hypothetical protein [Mesorhizobium temperatum]